MAEGRREFTSATEDSDTGTDDRFNQLPSRERPEKNCPLQKDNGQVQELPSTSSSVAAVDCSDQGWLGKILDELESTSMGAIAKWKVLDSDSAIGLAQLSETNEALKQKIAMEREAIKELEQENEAKDKGLNVAKSQLDDVKKKLASVVEQYMSCITENMRVAEEKLSSGTQAVEKLSNLREHVESDLKVKDRMVQAYLSFSERKLKELIVNETFANETNEFIYKVIDELKNSQKKMAETRKLLDDSLEKMNEAKRKKADRQREIDTKLKLLERKQQNFNELKEQDDARRHEYDKLVVTLETAKNDAAKIKQEWLAKIDEKKNAIQKKQIEQDILKNEFENGEERLRLEQEKLTAIKQKRAYKSKQKDNLLKQIAETEKGSKERAAIIESLRREIEVNCGKQRQLRERVEEAFKLEGQNQALEARVAEMETRASSGKKMVDQARDSLKASKLKLEEEKRNVEYINNERDRLRQKKTTIDADIIKMKQLLNEKTLEHQRRIDEKDVKSGETKAKLTALKGDLSELEGRIEKARELKKALEIELKSVNDMNDSKKDMNEEQRQLLERIDEEKEKIESQMKVLESHVPKRSLEELNAQLESLFEEREKMFQEHETELKNMAITQKSAFGLWEESLTKSKEEVLSKISEKQRSLDKLVLKRVPRLTVEKDESERKLRQTNESMVMEIKQMLDALKIILDGYSRIRSRGQIRLVDRDVANRLESSLRHCMEAMCKWEALSNVTFIADDHETYLKIYDSFRNAFDSMIQEREDVEPVTFSRKVIPLMGVFTKSGFDANGQSESSVPASVATGSQRSTQEDS